MESFEIPVHYKGTEHSFKAELLTSKYSYKIQVDIDGILVLFEPDEERNYRAVLADPTDHDHKVDKQLVVEIASVLKKIME